MNKDGHCKCFVVRKIICLKLKFVAVNTHRYISHVRSNLNPLRVISTKYTTIEFEITFTLVNGMIYSSKTGPLGIGWNSIFCSFI